MKCGDEGYQVMCISKKVKKRCENFSQMTKMKHKINLKTYEGAYRLEKLMEVMSQSYKILKKLHRDCACVNMYAKNDRYSHRAARMFPRHIKLFLGMGIIVFNSEALCTVRAYEDFYFETLDFNTLS